MDHQVSRHHMSGIRVGAAAAGMLLSLAVAPAAPAQQSPNVLVIISDDAGWADFGFQGSTVIPTPNLDALAARGVAFSNAYAGSVCSPSRSMLTTGMYTTRIGYYNNIGADNSPINTVANPQGLPTSAITIWERMQAQGYNTGLVGKWHLGAHANGTDNGQTVLGNLPQNQGIEDFMGIISGSRSYTVGGATGESALRFTFSDGAGNVSSNQNVESQYSGQYVTDTFGDLSVNYIADHYNAADPFFLYTSFTAPHTPMQATAADLAAIDAMGNGLTGNRRTQAAMQLAMDRNVGKIMTALDDPNGDGNTADSIRDNTLAIFVNDNGGDSSDSDPNYSSNLPLKNGKGSQWEGGIRVPMIVAGAGVDAAYQDGDIDIIHAPVHVIDILPTAFAAAGGSFGQSDVIDGVNLLPYINGQTQAVPHETLYLTRYSGDQAAVRMGDHKLMYRPADGFMLFNLTTDPGEKTNLAAQNPELVDQLQRVMTDYDVQMDKPRHDLNAAATNQFDAFRFREGAFATANWSDADAWNDNNANSIATMTTRDGYANTVLLFRNRNNSGYTATNDLFRVGGLDFMANEIRFIDRNEVLVNNGTATIDGLPVLMTKSLSGNLPKLSLNATIDGPNVYTYDLALDLKLYDDLQVTGDGDQVFVVSGAILEYRAGRSLTKTGSSTLILRGNNDLTGQITVEQGRLESENGNALGQADLFIGDGATLTANHTINIAVGRVLAGSGVVEADVFSEGLVLPGSSPGVLSITGSFAAGASSAVMIEVAGTSPGTGHDVLNVGADASLDGQLWIEPTALGLSLGDRLGIVQAGSVNGSFSVVSGGDLSGGLQFVLEYRADGLDLVVRRTGDMDGDAQVNQSDLDALLSGWGGASVAGVAGDWNGDGRIDTTDLLSTLRNWTDSSPPAFEVPEPSGLVCLLVGMAMHRRSMSR